MRVRFLIGPCEICEQPASLGEGDRACEICDHSFDKLCASCSSSPCPRCGSYLKKAVDVFPNSLFAAIESGSFDKIESILSDHPVKLNCIRDRGGHHPLARAALLKNRDQAIGIVKQLLGQGATAHARTGEVGRTTLMLMVRYRIFHKAVADLLRCSINDADDQGQTALMFAVEGQGLFGQRRGNLSIAKHLIKIGADLAIKDMSGKTAMDHAILANDTGMNGDVINLLR